MTPLKKLIIFVLILCILSLLNILTVYAKSDSPSKEHYLHHSHKKEYEKENLTTEAEWDDLNKTSSVKFKGKFKIKPDIQVFGWHPFWKGSAYKNYNFSLLTTVAYFSYDLNPHTGFYKSIHNWKETKLIEMAHKERCKVLLAVTNFGKEENTTFLNNTVAQKKMIETVIKLIRERGADGVAVDFEGVAHDDDKKFVAFIAELSGSLKKENKNYTVAVALPGIEHHHAYDVASLDKYVDTFIIMTYNYYGSWTKDAGPVAPLQSEEIWNENNVDRSVKSYLDTGVKPSKFLLGIAYFGAQWETDTGAFPSKASKYEGHKSYSTIRKAHNQRPSFDPASKTAYYLTTQKGKAQHVDQWFDVGQLLGQKQVQLWFDDPQSLRQKYDHVMDKKLGGIAIWALGYDDGYIDLWNLLYEKFSTSGSSRSTQRRFFTERDKYFFILVLVTIALVLVVRRFKKGQRG